MSTNVINSLEFDFSAKRDMTESYLVAQDLSNLDLSKAVLDRAELDCAILTDANLSHTSLKGTSFFSADLEGANLRHAKVRKCNFRHANLEGADVTGVDFSTSNVRGAIFTDAIGLSLQQKLWLKSNGALNIEIDRSQRNHVNSDDRHDGVFGKVRSAFSAIFS